MKKYFSFVFWSSIFLSLFIFQACSNHKKNAKDNNISIDKDIFRIDGSSTAYPLTSLILDEFTKESDLKIELNVSGTGGGFRKFSKGETMINNASRKINEKEIAKCKKNGIEYDVFEIAYDGIALVVNQKNDWVHNLTVAELKYIWKENGAKKWSDIRVSWPDKEIVLFGPGKASGTRDYFKSTILGDLEFQESYTKSENDNLLVTAISKNIYSFGFFGLSYYTQNKDKLKVLAIDNGDGPVLPSQETVSSQEYMPLSRSIYLYVNKGFYQEKEGKRFVKFYMKNAASYASETGCIALPESYYRKSIEQLN